MQHRVRYQDLGTHSDVPFSTFEPHEDQRPYHAILKISVKSKHLHSDGAIQAILLTYRVRATASSMNSYLRNESSLKRLTLCYSNEIQLNYVSTNMRKRRDLIE
jgi:hypothetical protein